MTGNRWNKKIVLIIKNLSEKLKLKSEGFPSMPGVLPAIIKLTSIMKI